MSEAVCLEGSGCMVRGEVKSIAGDVDVLFSEMKDTKAKVQSAEVSLAKMAAVGEFLKWAIPIAVTATGIICSVLTWALTITFT